MKLPNLQMPSLTELYSRPYDDRTLEWRRLGAIDKADHVRQLLGARASEIQSVVEVGSGTGDVLYNLAWAGLGQTLIGLEISDERVRPGRAVRGSQIELMGFDGRKIEFADRSVDLIYATHVLEHAVYERELLHEMSRVARKYVYVEVPLEIHLRTSWQALDTTLHIGHINAYDRHSFLLKLETSGLRVIACKTFDHSLAVHRFGSSLPKAAAKAVIRRAALALGFGPFMMTYHFGALCEPAARLDIS